MTDNDMKYIALLTELALKEIKLSKSKKEREDYRSLAWLYKDSNEGMSMPGVVIKKNSLRNRVANRQKDVDLLKEEIGILEEHRRSYGADEYTITVSIG